MQTHREKTEIKNGIVISKKLLIGIFIVLIVGAAVFYIVKEKKTGAKCIGCPGGATCSGSCGSCDGVCHETDTK